MHSGRENSVRAMLVAAAVVRHRGVSKGGFGAFTLDGIEFAVFKQPRREAAQFGVGLDDQHRSTVLLGLPHIRPLPLSVRYGPHPIVASAPPGIPAPGRKRHRPIRPAVRLQTPAGTSSGRGRWRAEDASQCSDGPPLAQPFGRAPYVVNTTEAILFRGGGKIFAGSGAEPVVPRADDELAISKGAQTFLRPFPFSRSPPAEGR